MQTNANNVLSSINPNIYCSNYQNQPNSNAFSFNCPPSNLNHADPNTFYDQYNQQQFGFSSDDYSNFNYNQYQYYSDPNQNSNYTSNYSTFDTSNMMLNYNNFIDQNVGTNFSTAYTMQQPSQNFTSYTMQQPSQNFTSYTMQQPSQNSASNVMFNSLQQNVSQNSTQNALNNLTPNIMLQSDPNSASNISQNSLQNSADLNNLANFISHYFSNCNNNNTSSDNAIANANVNVNNQITNVSQAVDLNESDSKELLNIPTYTELIPTSSINTNVQFIASQITPIPVVIITEDSPTNYQPENSEQLSIENDTDCQQPKNVADMSNLMTLSEVCAAAGEFYFISY